MTTTTAAPKYEVRNVRHMRGSHDDAGYTAKLYLNDKFVAEVVDDGYGGEIQTRWTSRDPKVARAQEVALRDYVKTLPSKTYRDTELPMDVAFFIAILVDEASKKECEAAEHKRIIKLCQTKVLFREAGDKDKRSWSTYNGLFTAKMRQMVLDRHGADCVFANETIAGQVASEGADVDAKAKALQDAAFRAKVIRGCRKDVWFRTPDNKWRAYKGQTYTLKIQALIDAQYPGSFVANREWAGQIPA